MPFINKVTVRGTTYYLENLTDGSNIVRLPRASLPTTILLQKIRWAKSLLQKKK